MGITIAMAMASVRRGWDMDNVSAPVVTAAGDLITLPALWLASFLLPIGPLDDIIAIVCGIALVAATIRLIRTKGNPLLKKIVSQSIPILLIAGEIDIIAGVTIDRRMGTFLALPVLLILTPPFLEDAGALGGILSARLSSKLHLGTISPKAIPGRRTLADIVLIYILAIPVFVLVGTSSTIVAAALGKAHPGFGPMIELALISGVIATTGAVFVAYYSAVIGYRYGLDPDNFGIPILTSAMDLMGAFALIASMVILGIAR
jgi:mgtE-like transporter